MAIDLFDYGLSGLKSDRMADKIEILVRDVSDVEGHVLARYIGDVSVNREEPLTMQGTLRGPYCETSRTLPAEIRFRDLGRAQPGLAEAIVPDPCVWSSELPHLYQVDIEAHQGGRVVAEYHGMIGLRSAGESQ